jgi:hypothetical protein
LVDRGGGIYLFHPVELPEKEKTEKKLLERRKFSDNEFGTENPRS